MNTLKKLLAAAAAALAAGPALAAVNGSHHDLTAYQSGATEVCLYCHGVRDLNSATGNFGNVGELCMARCHNASGYVTDAGVMPNRAASIAENGALIPAVPTVNAVNVTSGYAHGLTKADLLDAATGTSTVAFNSIGLGFPYGGNAVLECTSCHNVHDNTNTPFLQVDLFGGGPAGRPSFCEACHTNRGNSWAGGETPPNGEHPTNFPVVLGNSTRTNAERLGRYINLDGTIFEQASPNGTDLNDPAQHYVTGGKVGGFTNAVSGMSTFGCYTCHAVHVDATDAGWQAPNLILRDATSSDGTWNPICTGCHGVNDQGVDDPNPGLSTSDYFHPVGSQAAAGTDRGGSIWEYTTSTGSFKFNVSLAALTSLGPAGAIADTVVGIETITAKPRCGSCHDVHGGINNSMALVDLDGTRNGSFAGKICDACHTGVGLVDVADDSGASGEPANSHHRTRTGSWAGTTVTDADGNTLNLDGTEAASWLTTEDHTNGLGCADCHVFDGSTHSTAHNW